MNTLELCSPPTKTSPILQLGCPRAQKTRDRRIPLFDFALAITTRPEGNGRSSASGSEIEKKEKKKKKKTHATTSSIVSGPACSVIHSNCVVPRCRAHTCHGSWSSRAPARVDHRPRRALLLRAELSGRLPLQRAHLPVQQRHSAGLRAGASDPEETVSKAASVCLSVCLLVCLSADPRGCELRHARRCAGATSFFFYFLFFSFLFYRFKGLILEMRFA